VFSGLTIGVEAGMRVGIVGRNGDGKSSLLGLLTRTIDPTAGRVTHRRGLRLGLLGQRDDLDDTETVGHAVVGDTPEHEWAGDAGVRDVVRGLIADLDW